MRAIERAHGNTGNRYRSGGMPTKTDTERALNELVPAGALSANGKPLHFFGRWLREKHPAQFERAHRLFSGIE